MDFKFGNDSKEPAPAAPAEKSRQNMLLVVLLILVAAFAYLYFFTGLIKPQQEQKQAEAPAPQVVKKPLPPRDGQPAKDETAGAPGAQKNAAAPEAQKVASAEPPVAAKAAPGAKVEPPKPEPAKTAVPEKKPAPPEKKAAPGAPAPNKPAATAKPEDKKAAPAPKQQPAGAVKKPAPAPGSDKKPAEAAKAPAKGPAGAAVPARNAAPTAAKKDTAQPKAAPAKQAGPWTVVVGTYVLEEAMAKDLSRAKGAGVETAVKQAGRKKTAMNRLLAGEYPSRAAAQPELDKLKRYTSDAFILEQGGKFAVYAGSYLLPDRAGSERERLAAAGINLTVKHAEVSIPSKTLVAGTFSDRKKADAVLKKLKGLGIKASLSHP